MEGVSDSVKIILENLERFVDCLAIALSADHFENLQARTQHRADSQKWREYATS